jgi:hypothetical protein
MPLCLVHAALEGLHPNELQSDIRRGTLRRNSWCYLWGSHMWRMQCNVKFGYQLSICSGTKETHGKSWTSWPVAGPSGCKLTSSQQSGIKYASPNISPYLCCFYIFSFLFFFQNFYKLFLQTFVSVCNLDKHQTVYNTCGGNECVFAQIFLQL